MDQLKTGKIGGYNFETVQNVSCLGSKFTAGVASPLVLLGDLRFALARKNVNIAALERGILWRMVDLKQEDEHFLVYIMRSMSNTTMVWSIAYIYDRKRWRNRPCLKWARMSTHKNLLCWLRNNWCNFILKVQFRFYHLTILVSDNSHLNQSSDVNWGINDLFVHLLILFLSRI